MIHSSTLGENATSDARTHLTSAKSNLPSSLNASQFAILTVFREQVDRVLVTAARVTEERLSVSLMTKVEQLLRQFSSFYGGSLADLSFIPNDKTEGGEVEMDYSLFVGGMMRLEVEFKAANAVLDQNALLWRLDDFVSAMEHGYATGREFDKKFPDGLVNLIEKVSLTQRFPFVFAIPDD